MPKTTLEPAPTLANKTLAELRDMMAELAPGTAASGKAEAIQIVLRALSGRRQLASSKPKPKARRTGPRKKPPGRPRKPFDYPLAAEQKEPRVGSLRSRLADFLITGRRTVADVRAHFDWDAKNAFEHLKLLHTTAGYGLREDEAGILYLTTQ